MIFAKSFLYSASVISLSFYSIPNLWNRLLAFSLAISICSYSGVFGFFLPFFFPSSKSSSISPSGMSGNSPSMSGLFLAFSALVRASHIFFCFMLVSLFVLRVRLVHGMLALSSCKSIYCYKTACSSTDTRPRLLRFSTLVCANSCGCRQSFLM